MKAQLIDDPYCTLEPDGKVTPINLIKSDAQLRFPLGNNWMQIDRIFVVVSYGLCPRNAGQSTHRPFQEGNSGHPSILLRASA